MSPLTKILVILVVVLALLQSAATVVFVNRVDTAATSASQTAEMLKSVEAKNASLQQQYDAVNAQKDSIRTQTDSVITNLQNQLRAVEQQLKDRDVKLAQSGSQLALQSTDLARLAEALKASEDTKSKQVDMITELRKFNDDFSKKVTDLNAANADLTNRLEVTERDRKFLQEQNQELQNQAQRATAAMKDAGVAAPSAGAAVGLTKGAPAINATIREVRTLGNVPYATISAGSADRVVAGMQFRVIDSSGNFLGNLTIDRVESNEALGRLSGPRVADIKPGADARTQL